MDGFFGDWADLNGDGEVDNFEKLVELEELEMAGLDYDDLSYMDVGERREAFEDAGVDPDDYNF